MTIIVRRSAERSHVSKHASDRWATFSPEHHNDPLSIAFRVLNSLVEYDLAPGMGFLVQTHQDNDMVTYVEDGSLIREDSAGPMAAQKAGEFHNVHVSPETTHNAVNRSPVEHAHVIQSGITTPPHSPDPDTEQKRFSRSERMGILRLIASPDGSEGSLRLCLDVRMYSSLLRKGTHLIHEFLHGRRGWLQVVAGQIQLHEHVLEVGDGAGLIDERSASFTARIPSEVLLFDLP